jgi:hypothetical protein
VTRRAPGWIGAVVAIAAAAPARAEPIRVVVRDTGGGDTLAVKRLRGQVADLAIEASLAPGPLEPTLDAQVGAAARLAGDARARAVVWFVPRGGELDVAVVTPDDHRLFLRSIPRGAGDDDSAVAEAAAVAARGALRAIAMGGTIGVELPPPPPRAQLEAAVGWQIALDGGADAGGHALAQRTTLVEDGWAISLELSLGPALRRRGDVVLDLSRSGAALAVERRLGGGIAIGGAAGVLLYHRATITPPGGLSATPSSFTAAAVAGPALRWQWRPRDWPIGIEAVAALDVVAGAPELVVSDAMGVHTIGTIRIAQPRFGLSIIAGLP